MSKLNRPWVASHGYIMARHILPNLFDIVFVRGGAGGGKRHAHRSQPQLFGAGGRSAKKLGRHPPLRIFRSGIINGYWWWYLPPSSASLVSVLGFLLLSYGGSNNWEEETDMLDIEHLSVRFGGASEAVAIYPLSVGEKGRP